MLSEQQQIAVDSVLNWLKNETEEKKIFRLFGYAGTGKTTIAKDIADAFDGKVKFGAFTGKASYVLRTKGCEDASTLHSLIYNPKIKSKEHLLFLKEELKIATDLSTISMLENSIREEKENINRVGFTLNLESCLKETDLLIVDECSMVGHEMGADLMYFGCPVLALGDPAQLPPVKDQSGKPLGFFIEQEPDIMLTEVHRHALESPIYRWATRVRQQWGLQIGVRDECFVKYTEDIDDRDLETADIVIVGRNNTRHEMNDRIRKNRGYGERESKWTGMSPFLEGEKILCLKNNKNYNLSNGSVYSVVSVIDTDLDFTMALIRSDDGEEVTVPIANPIFYGLGILDCEEDLTYFDYGYCLTCHKSQGSQWKTVLIVDESNCFRADKWKWLYTAITRASERVWIGM